MGPNSNTKPAGTGSFSEGIAVGGAGSFVQVREDSGTRIDAPHNNRAAEPDGTPDQRLCLHGALVGRCCRRGPLGGNAGLSLSPPIPG